MTIRDEMKTQFTTYARSTLLQQVIADMKQGAVEFYVVIEDAGAFAVAILPTLKHQLSDLADSFGAALLTMRLADLADLWNPGVPLSPRGDYQDALSHLHWGEMLAVVEEGKPVGVMTRSHRSIGSSALGSMYGPRFALFGDEPSGPPPPPRTCPNCRRTIDFYKPKRVDGVIERHCPACDFLISTA